MSKRGMCAIAAAAACAALLLGGCSRESADWKQASVANTPEAYQLFLQQHPHGAEAPQAQSRLQQLSEQRDWQIASTTDTRDGYQQFVTKHPDSKWVQEARIRIENFAQAGVSGGAALAANPAGEPAAGSAPAASPAAGKGAAVGSPPASTARTSTPARASIAARTSPAARAASAARTVSRSQPSTRSPAARHTHSALVARAHRSGHARAPLLQLGAFRSKARAQSEWRELTARFGTLRSFTPHYVVARSRGTRVVRLQVRVPSTRVASGLCATLKRHARACVRVNAA
jgi:SPOR domain